VTWTQSGRRLPKTTYVEVRQAQLDNTKIVVQVKDPAVRVGTNQTGTVFLSRMEQRQHPNLNDGRKYFLVAISGSYSVPAAMLISKQTAFGVSRKPCFLCLSTGGRRSFFALVARQPCALYPGMTFSLMATQSSRGRCYFRKPLTRRSRKTGPS
jgi:hypothetical protein